MLHSWCHMKLLLTLCVHRTSSTSSQCHFIPGHIRRVSVCSAVTCHLHVWQNDRNHLRAAAITRGWNGYRNESQHRKLTLEKTILPPRLPGLDLLVMSPSRYHIPATQPWVEKPWICCTCLWLLLAFLFGDSDLQSNENMCSCSLLDYIRLTTHAKVITITPTSCGTTLLDRCRMSLSPSLSLSLSLARSFARSLRYTLTHTNARARVQARKHARTLHTNTLFLLR